MLSHSNFLFLLFFFFSFLGVFFPCSLSVLLCQSLSYFGTKHTKGKTYEKEEKDDGFVNVGVGIWVDKLRKNFLS